MQQRRRPVDLTCTHVADAMHPPPKRASIVGRLLRTAAWAGAGLVLVAVGWWAAGQVSTPRADVTSGPATTWYEIRTGTISDSVQMTVYAQWQPRTTLAHTRPGILTEQMASDGAVVDDGDIVGTVDLQPLVVAEGAIPAFRDLRAGQQGKDIAQLQAFLARAGLYDGPVDGRWGGATTTAVKSWQAVIGLDPDGRIPLGTLLFVDSLPAAIAWQAKVGDRISEDSDILALLENEPTFTIQLRRAVLAGLPPDSIVIIEGPRSTEWAASLGPVRDLGGDEVEVLLGSRQTICGERCNLLPVQGKTRLVGEVVLVPDTTGPVAPAGAIRVSPDGSTFVTERTRGRVEVSVLASADGLVVLSGVQEGDRVAITSLDTKTASEPLRGAQS